MRAFVGLALAVLVATAVGVVVEAASVPSAPPPARYYTITTGQPAIRVLVAGRCPASVAGDRDVANRAGGLAHELVPRAPLAALICRYGVPNSASAPQYALVRSARLGPGPARRLARAIDAVSTARPRAIASCPAAFALASVIALAYARGPNVDLWYADTGCQHIDNGHLEASEVDNAAFVGVLVRVVDALAPRPVVQGL